MVERKVLAPTEGSGDGSPKSPGGGIASGREGFSPPDRTTSLEEDAPGPERAGILLTELVGIPSVSGSEAAACALLASRLPELGWDRVDRDGTGNVIAERGRGERELLLLGHIDTVPGGPPVRVEGDLLWGRGSVDAKGALTAFALAGGSASPPEGWRFTLVAAVGEERDSRGTRARLPLHRPSACLIGEPSGTEGITVGYRGRLLLELFAEDPGAHRSGSPGPITAVLRAGAAVLDLVDREDVRDRPVIERPSGAVIALEGAEEEGRCGRVEMEIRLPLGAEPEDWADAARERARAFGAECRIRESVRARQVRRDDPAVRGLRSAIRSEGGTPRLLAKGGTADFNWAAEWGCPLAAWGPGDSRLDHTAEERLSLSELERAVTILRRALPLIALGADRSGHI
jgi:LysW-gamma-L-lysine carboxypeptidase